MAGKKKKGKKGRRKGSEELKSLSPEQMMEKGRELIASGKLRDAVSMLKAAGKQGAEVKGLLFQAYLERETQLRAKGMDEDARGVRLQALSNMPEPRELSENELYTFAQNSPFEEGINLYANYLKGNPRSDRTETLIAGLALLHSPGKLPGGIGDDFPLARDSQEVFRAIRLMNDGLWEDALEPLSSIPRSSPYASIRLFCNAMVSFYREDDRGMRRALSMIPEFSPLMPLVERLSRPVPDLPCLWDGPLNTEDLRAELMDIIENNNHRGMKKAVADFAGAVFPEISRRGAAISWS